MARLVVTARTGAFALLKNRQTSRAGDEGRRCLNNMSTVLFNYRSNATVYPAVEGLRATGGSMGKGHVESRISSSVK